MAQKSGAMRWFLEGFCIPRPLSCSDALERTHSTMWGRAFYGFRWTSRLRECLTIRHGFFALSTFEQIQRCCSGNATGSWSQVTTITAEMLTGTWKYKKVYYFFSSLIVPWSLLLVDSNRKHAGQTNWEVSYAESKHRKTKLSIKDKPGIKK